jgi:hypothetical protein
MPSIGHGGRQEMHQGGMLRIDHERIMEIVETFRKNGATTPETAMALEELELPPMFKMMLQGQFSKSGLFLEHNGKYYVSEERFKRMRERFGSR